MKKKLGLVVLTLILSLLITVMATSCNNHPEQPDIGAGRGLSVSFLKDFTFDLDGVVSLGIEKRPVKKKVSKMVAYADDEEEKNYLVGETEDREVIKIMLLNKLGEAYSQDELPAQFNKLYVSGNFIFFELIPADVYDNISEYGSYCFYLPEDLDDNGNPIEGATPKDAYIPLRENQAEEDLEDFDKSSTPNAVSGAFVYSMENEKIYDLSETGYEVIGNGVVSMSDEVYRVSINEDNELVTTPAFSSFASDKVFNVKVDKYGNIFAESTKFSQAEDGVYIVNVDSDDFVYVFDETGQAVQLVQILGTDNWYGTVYWVDENGIRELQASDNFKQKKITVQNMFYWAGIVDGIPQYYHPNLPYVIDRKVREQFDEEMTIFMLTPNIAVAYSETNKDIPAIWFDIEEQDFHLIVNSFASIYPNAVGEHWGTSPDTFIVTTSQGETTYEFYWDEEEETVKIRTVEEITSKPIEVKKFQPIT